MLLCYMCHEWKPGTEFAFRSKKTGKRQSQCRECHARYRREHYVNNRQRYIDREVKRIDGYRRTNRVRLFEYLTTHPCVDCGEADPVVLEFDHRDPTTKRASVTAVAAKKPWKFVADEIAKCEVRCVNCHRRRTAAQFGWQIAQRDDTSASQATTAPNIVELVIVSEENLRTCTVCGMAKPLSEFSLRNKKTGRRSRQCKACVATRSRAHYRQNRESYLVRTRSTKKTYRARNRAQKAGLLAGLACVDCGETDPRVLDFDHRDGANKSNEVSRLMSSGSWLLIMSEIAKCEVRCANCHRRRTAEVFGYTRFALSRSSATSTQTGALSEAVEPYDGTSTIVAIAGVAQLAEHLLPKQRVARSNRVTRSATKVGTGANFFMTVEPPTRIHIEGVI